MDTSVSPIVAGSVASALVAAILALWRWVVVSNRKCEERGVRLEDEIKITKDMLIVSAREERTRAEVREERAHARAQAREEREVHVATVLDNTTEVTKWAVEHLLRFDPANAHKHLTPPPGLRVKKNHTDDDSNMLQEGPT